MPTDSTPPACAAILVAAGSSRRMGFDKLAARLGGLPVLRRTVEAFLRAETIQSVTLVCPPERMALLEGLETTKPLNRVDGGADRHDSVANGLAGLPPGAAYVAVHDGARPLVSPDDIDRTVRAAFEHQAAALARRATETMKRGDEQDFCAESVSRENLWFMETPQVFSLPLLKRAYQIVIDAGWVVTDEVSAMEAAGMRTRFIEAAHPNLKITTPADLALAEALLAKRS